MAAVWLVFLGGRGEARVFGAREVHPRYSAVHSVVAEAEGEPLVWTFREDPIRASDGRIWFLRNAGKSAAVLRHWDGETWSEWVLPKEVHYWLPDALWVDARGRVVLLSENLRHPAWELDKAVPGGWRTWYSGQELVAARASESEPVASLGLMGPRAQRAPVFSGDGRALVGGYDDGLWYFARGEWRLFTKRETGYGVYRFGFSDEDKVPWIYAERSALRRMDAAGAWRVEEGRPEESALREEWRRRVNQGSDDSEWRKVLAGALDLNRVQSAERDEEGVWWFLYHGRLHKWKGGKVVSVFDANQAKTDRDYVVPYFRGVRVDARGNRLFISDPYVLLPASPGPVVNLKWVRPRAPGDRSAKLLSGGGLGFEWRLSEGAWHFVSGSTLTLRELIPGVYRLEVRGLSERLDCGPVKTEVFRVAYDQDARIAQLIRILGDDPTRRADAVRRLVAHGGKAEVALRSRLAVATNDDINWWLRAALQEIADARAREGRSLP